ncbi:MAG: transcriptional regulator, partial [Rhodospirillales bacterium]|nr:transcriptional regulator [Rhodospirillales bacterium]
EQIVEAGMTVLLEKGFNGCGVQEITDCAGVPKGSFYNHFESKEALGAEIVERYAERSVRGVLADRSFPPIERLRLHFEALNERYIGFGFRRGCLLGNFSAELSDQSALIRARLAEVFAHWTKDLEAAISEAQAQGAIGASVPAAELAAFLLNAYEGALLRARVEKNRDAFENFMRVAFTKILT